MHESQASSEPKLGLALSGGGSRAIAFHLGSLKALEELGLLCRVSVISTVSGGSVIGAMWAYSTTDFASFEANAEDLLKRGFARDIIWSLLRPQQVFKSVVTFLILQPCNVLCIAGYSFVGLLNRAFGRARDQKGSPRLICRWASRTTAFEHVLKKKLFKDECLDSPRRRNLHIVINACDLTSGVSVRFGSKCVANYIYGTVEPADVAIATAVCASSAYPLIFPSLDVTLNFEKNNEITPRRVALTDGGVYDNLGISALEPQKDPTISRAAEHVDYLLCSSAGQGRPRIGLGFNSMIPRLISVSLVQFRKLQDSGMHLLHEYKQSRGRKGFTLAYLGQDDSRWTPESEDFVSRQDVMDYPTNYSAMSEKNISLLKSRGYQLMMNSVRTHCNELIDIGVKK